MVSTPSRSRQATRISLPDMTGPSSERLAGCAFLSSVWVLFIPVFAFGLAPKAFGVGGRRCTKNPRPFASRGFLSKSNLLSTSPNGVANYDDQNQSDLSNVFPHRR